MMPYRHRLPFLRNLRRKLLRMNEPNACTISKKPGAASNRRRLPWASAGPPFTACAVTMASCRNRSAGNFT